MALTREVVEVSAVSVHSRLVSEYLLCLLKLADLRYDNPRAYVAVPADADVVVGGSSVGPAEATAAVCAWMTTQLKPTVALERDTERGNRVVAARFLIEQTPAPQTPVAYPEPPPPG